MSDNSVERVMASLKRLGKRISEFPVYDHWFGDKVDILGADGEVIAVGVVRAFWVDLEGTSYSVTWWESGKRHSNTLRADELRSRHKEPEEKSDAPS